MVVAFTRSVYAVSVISVLQIIGYLDYRVAYAATCYVLWQALAFKYPSQTTYAESQAAWYTLKGVTIAGRTCKPVLDWTKTNVLGPLHRSIVGPKSGDGVFLVSKNGTVVHACGLHSELPISEFAYRPDLVASSELPDYEFVIYEWTAPANSQHESFILRFKSLKDVTDSFQFSDVKFLAPRIVIGKDGPRAGDIFDIADDFNERNYYMCGNRLFDRPFVAWYLKEHFDFSPEDKQDYKVEFLDHNMTKQVVMPDQAVIMKKAGYDIVEVQSDHPTLRKRSTRISGAGEEREEVDKWAKENAYLRAGKKALDKVTVKPDDIPSHKKYPWAQLY